MNDFEPKPSEELSFFLGAWLGDGWADESDGGKRLLLKVRSREFAEEFAGNATKILNKTEPYKVREITDEAGKWYFVKVTSMLLYDFVRQPFAKLKGHVQPHPARFLRAFFTAEGNPTTSLYQNRGRLRLVVDICLSNTDRRYLQFARRIMQELGYHPTSLTSGGKSVTITNLSVRRQTVWQFRLVRLDEIEDFTEEIGFSDQLKQSKILEALYLIRKLNPFEAAQSWLRLYHKVGGTWVRGHRDTQTIA